MRLLTKNLPVMTMLAASFASGVVVTLIFCGSGPNPTVLMPAAHPASSFADSVRPGTGRRTRETCVCDKEADRLKRIARMFLRSIPVNETDLAANKTTRGNDFYTSDNITEIKTFLYPSKSGEYRGIPLGVPQLLNEEYLMKEPLLIGILTKQEYLDTRALAVYNTWAKDITEGSVVFFVGEDCKIAANLSHLPIIKLRGIPDNVYPPLKKAFAVMRYMYDNFINDYNWFIRADDDMYVRGQLLTDLLKRMSPYERIYLGRAGIGKDNDQDRLHLLPHERYCMGGPGVVFSNAAMRAIGPHLDQCLNAVFFHDQQSSEKWNDDDVEIGRCISRKLDFQCSTSAESRLKFHTDYSGDSLHPLTLWSKPIFKEIISMHPVKDPFNMFAIHHFYKTLEFEEHHEELLDLMAYTNSLCRNLPSHLFPPAFISTGCDVKVNQIKEQLPGGTYIVDDDKPVVVNPTDVYDDTRWTFFNKGTVFDIGGVTLRSAMGLSYKAEIKHIESLLHRHLAQKIETRDYSLDEILHGYARFLPATGREFRLRIKLSHRSQKDIVKFLSVRLLRRLSNEIGVSVVPTEVRPLHVILPLLSVDDRFREFLKNYVQQGLGKGITLSLVVVIFNEMSADLVEGIVKQLTRGFPNAVVTIAISEGQFSFPHAVDLGMSVIKNKNDVVFVADLTTRIRADFWSRCRDNARSTKQVYFPTPFSVYVSDLKTTILNASYSYPIKEWTGEWGVYSSRTFCVTKEDYDNLGGYKDALSSSHFFQKVAESKLELFQSPEPGLYQLWPAKTCSNLSAAKRRVCEVIVRNTARFQPVDHIEFLFGQDKAKSYSWRN